MDTPRQLIVTVYGLYAREAGGWLSVAALVRLLAELGVDGQAVRSAISRLKRTGILLSQRSGGAAGYTLSGEAREILHEGDRRIFRLPTARVEDGFVLAVFSVPESMRDKRHLLRTELTRLGYGTAAPGVWVAPAHRHEETAAMLARLALQSYVDLFRAEPLGQDDLRGKVGSWWDLDRLRQGYDAFLAEYGPMPVGGSPFADYVRILTDWRRLPYLDPGLPAVLLPADWPAQRALAVFLAAKARLEDPAREFVRVSVTGSAEMGNN